MDPRQGEKWEKIEWERDRKGTGQIICRQSLEVRDIVVVPPLRSMNFALWSDWRRWQTIRNLVPTALLRGQASDLFYDVFRLPPGVVKAKGSIYTTTADV